MGRIRNLERKVEDLTKVVEILSSAANKSAVAISCLVDQRLITELLIKQNDSTRAGLLAALAQETPGAH